VETVQLDCPEGSELHSVTVPPKGAWKGFEVEVKGKLATLKGEVFLRPTAIVGDTW
jgi:hypothetical protein